MRSGRRKLFIFLLVFLFTGIYTLSSCQITEQAGSYIRYSMGKEMNANDESEGLLNLEEEELMLPEPDLESDFSLEEALKKRRSVRNFSGHDLELDKISQLLWAAQGITQKDTGYRTTPSAGALYPLEVFLVKSDGAYHYQPEEHRLVKLLSGDLRDKLAKGSLYQDFIAMDLGAVPVGAFDDDYIRNLLDLPSDYSVLYIIPVGYQLLIQLSEWQNCARSCGQISLSS